MTLCPRITFSALPMTFSLEQGILLFSSREEAGGQSVWPGQFSFEVICEVGLNTEASAGHQTFEKHHTHCPEAEQLNVFEVQWSFCCAVPDQ